MPVIRFGPRDLLEYDSRYGVVICRECKYAIQKSALQSHLLRHKIYRSKRQHLLSYIAELDLFEPENVPLPTPGSPPIGALSIISGYRCARCENLCASSKRMRRHWNEVHGPDKRPDSSISLPVKLQTFFRGTKLQYFEVDSSSVADTVGVAPLATTTITNDNDNNDNNDGNDNDNNDNNIELNYEGQSDDIGTRLRPHTPTIPGTSPGSSPANFDLETLTYFHHFTTATSLTLPSSAENKRSATHYWQTDIVLQALQRRWLMCGLLAISACHLAVLADNTAIEQAHRKRSVQFFSEFLVGWEEIAKSDICPGVEEEVKKAGGQITCILRCAQWALAKSTSDQETIPELVVPSQLKFIIATVRGSVIPGFRLPPDRARNNEDGGQPTWDSSVAGKFNEFPSRGNTPLAIYNSLHSLPSRMDYTAGKPESVQDFLALLLAIAALVECCDTSFSSDEVDAVCEGMETWLIKVPDHFHHMVSCHNSAALVVLAHWAEILVKRSEHCGCWFLRGLSEVIQLHIAERIPADYDAFQRLARSPME